MNVTIARITLRALFGRRRFLMLLPLPVLLVGVAILARSLGAAPDEWVEPVIVALGIGIVIPVVALIVGTGVLGSEIDDGTLVHILAKPLPRSQILLSKLVVAASVTSITTGVPLFFTGLIAGSTSFGVGLLVGAVLGSIVYTTLFLLLSLVSRLPVLIGLIYIVVWEGLLTGLLSGTRVLSVRQYVITVAHQISGSDLLVAHNSLAVSLALSFIIAVGATLVAIDRLRSFSVAGETN
jgi:ABC-2 type transport system permease protein